MVLDGSTIHILWLAFRLQMFIPLLNVVCYVMQNYVVTKNIRGWNRFIGIACK